MRQDRWVPFYGAGRHGLVSLSETPGAVSKPTPAIISLASSFKAAQKIDADNFRFAVADIEKDRDFTCLKRDIEFPCYIEDRGMIFYPGIRLHFIAAEKNIGRAVDCVIAEAEQMLRPYHEDRDFWIGDLDLKALDMEKRFRTLSNAKGIPAGVIDRQHHAFIVRDDAVCKKIMSALGCSCQP